MKFTFTSFDKAIVAAIIGPLIVIATTYLNGGQVGSKELIAAVVAGVVAGVSVYLKGNNTSTAPVPPGP